MSFFSKMILGSKEFKVLHATYKFTQAIDQQNRPNGKPKGSTIDVTIESSTDNEITEWMVSDKMKKDGKIIFYKRDSESAMKTIAFKDAFCVEMEETFDADNKDPMKLRIKLSAGNISVNSKYSLTHPWSSVAASLGGLATAIGMNMDDMPGGGMMSNPVVADMAEDTKEAYETAKAGYDKGNEIKDKGEEVKGQVETNVDDVESKTDEMENKADKITSFIPD